MRIQTRASAALRATLAFFVAFIVALIVALIAGGWATPISAAPPPTMSGCSLTPVADAEIVSVQTPLGTIEIELYSNVAPLTVANFLAHIAQGDYDGTVVHRVVPGFVIQTGGFASSGIFFEEIDKGPNVPNEPCISNVAGTVAMAKLSGDPNSATSEWFVNLADNSTNLDGQNGGFTAFGQVLEGGLGVADQIAALGDRIPETPIPPYFAAVQNSVWSIFRPSPAVPASGSPLQQALTIDPVAYGCFDVDQSGILLVEDPINEFDWEPNLAHGLAFTLVSTACETGGGGAGVPSVSCTDPGRRVLRLDPDAGALVNDPGAPFGFEETLLSCDGLAASEASFDVRLNDVASQLDTSFVRTAYSVPEPGAALAGAVALASLAALRRTSRRGTP